MYRREIHKEYRCRQMHNVQAHHLYEFRAAFDLREDLLFIPFQAFRYPVFVHLSIGSRFIKYRVPSVQIRANRGCSFWIDLVTKGFTNLSDAKRNFISNGRLHITELGKDALSGFRAQISYI